MQEKQKNKLSRRTAQKVDNATVEELAAMTVNSLANESPGKFRENHNSQSQKEIQTICTTNKEKSSEPGQPPKKEESILQIFKNKIIKWFQPIIQ